MYRPTVLFIGILFSLLFLSNINSIYAQNSPVISQSDREKTIDAMTEKFGEAHRERIGGGVAQAAAVWLGEDGSPEDFRNFCLENFSVDPGGELFDRFEKDPGLSQIRTFSVQSKRGEQPEESRKNKTALIALLNYRVSTLEEKDRFGEDWTSLQWAQARLADRFRSRPPSAAVREIAWASGNAEYYIAGYAIHMGNVLTDDGRRLFPENPVLLPHWGLRDEIKAQYGAGAEGREKQLLLQKIMERIIDQSIPEAVIANSRVYWKPLANEVRGKNGEPAAPKPESPARYGHLRNFFRAQRQADGYGGMPTYMARYFEEELEISEENVESLLLEILESPEIKSCAERIEAKLERPLAAYDIWYDGLGGSSVSGETELDRMLRRRYPDGQAFKKDIPNILMKLGFPQEESLYLSDRIVVQPYRGAGHTVRLGGRDGKVYLRAPFDGQGLDYRGYRTAIHELGHCVESVISCGCIDYSLLAGVPNRAFTECFAFLFEDRIPQLLDLNGDSAPAETTYALDTLWQTYEISGASLVSIKIWNWMYAHPEASEQELQQTTLSIAREVWNRYYAPVLGEKDCTLLASYSHMIDSGLYLPNYPIGHMASYQIADHMRGRNLAAEMRRICLQGKLTPNLWMRRAVGSPVSAKPLLRGAAAALEKPASDR